jgi:hypothetical protein
MISHKLLNAGGSTSKQALELFDSLEPVDVGFMVGNWKGQGFNTGHYMDGLLEAYHWYGKRFEDSENVHPLVFSTMSGGFSYVNPIFMGPSMKLSDRFPIPKSAIFGRLFQFILPLMTTYKSRARLRMTTYRDKSSATMVYDQLPINDVFRKIDENAVLGIMDLKGMMQPFFFILRRET